jgi:hypothetical protein
MPPPSLAPPVPPYPGRTNTASASITVGVSPSRFSWNRMFHAGVRPTTCAAVSTKSGATSTPL